MAVNVGIRQERCEVGRPRDTGPIGKQKNETLAASHGMAVLHDGEELGIKRVIAAEHWLRVDGLPNLLTNRPK